MSKAPLPRKSLGQHWLRDATSLQAMADAANIQPTDTILEIGPGLGTLTQVLCKRAEWVMAIELDHILAIQLPSHVQSKNLEVIEQDILQFDFSSLPVGYKIVANIPYYLTSNLLRVLSESTNPPAAAVLLMQKEVAERVAAAPGQLSILGVTAQYFWDVSLGLEVPAILFTPPPKVDSQILILNWREKPLYGDVNSKVFFQIVKAGFSQKRKTLSNALSSGLHLEKAVVNELCTQANIQPGRRAQTLGLDEWNNLYKVYAQTPS